MWTQHYIRSIIGNVLKYSGTSYDIWYMVRGSWALFFLFLAHGVVWGGDSKSNDSIDNLYLHTLQFFFCTLPPIIIYVLFSSVKNKEDTKGVNL
jgi:hypothetical protein